MPEIVKGSSEEKFNIQFCERKLKKILEKRVLAEVIEDGKACERGEHGPRKVIMTSTQGAYEICPRCWRGYSRPLNSEEAEGYREILETPMTI
jgi:hypothetical protein